ncbi:hypothetical protein SHJG_8380 [Streptomyces hygroscopicus subsp. jinggangensis 5008]|nr:hypothetical protein SHJG_8380 [Streptomyces hygroscopicus subsp. jinggangensis 5008]AGF67803.1 hypothetical protein SHJGH_8141 [Streptomyces hygroscopicus subsp. jinggangensis TL01]
MIMSWGSGGGCAGRSRRAALLVGLVLVIAAHLSGAAHACSFAGPDPSALVTQDVRQVADGADETGSNGPPQHRHAADGHVDHTADRPRAALDDTALDGETHQPLLPAGLRGPLAHTARCRPPGVSPSCAHSSSLALVRVLRQ